MRPARSRPPGTRRICAKRSSWRARRSTRARRRPGWTSSRGSRVRFSDALAGPGLGAIAEIKRRSPSLGDIRPDADPGRIAREYGLAGAAAVSVLVDERFGGTWEDLRSARASSSVPLLAKGFFSTHEHLRTAKVAGADGILVGSTLMQAPDPAGKLRELLARPLVKVCGLTREEDVAVAAEAGADLAGFILAPESPRAAAEVLPVPDELLAVAVWVGETGASPASLDQLHEPAEGAVRSRDAVL